MADNKKITALTAISSLSTTDVLPIVDISDTETKKIAISQLDTRYLDGALQKTGGTMTGAIVLPGDPSTSLQASTKQYVDNISNNLKWKEPVRVATTTNGTLATDFENGDTIDGVVIATGDRILIKNQSTQTENGIYTINASGAPTRALDFDLWSEIVFSTLIVKEGSTNANKMYTCDVSSTGTIGTNNITFQERTSGGGTGFVDVLTFTPTAGAVAFTSATFAVPAGMTTTQDVTVSEEKEYEIEILGATYGTITAYALMEVGIRIDGVDTALGPQVFHQVTIHENWSVNAKVLLTVGTHTFQPVWRLANATGQLNCDSLLVWKVCVRG